MRMYSDNRIILTIYRGECTVVCTIHQPQTKIYNLLDNLLLMKKGSIVYQGSCAKAEAYFAAQGHPCPDRTNPADHLLDLYEYRFIQVIVTLCF